MAGNYKFIKCNPFDLFFIFQESCGSFDPLFSQLPENVGLLAFDFPGHGYSSRLPTGVYYHGIDAPILIRRIQNYFKWSKISLLGHSMGGITSFMYTTLYPNDVDMLIAIDALKPFSKEPGTAIQSTLENIDQFLRYESLNEAQTKPPSYTYDELVNKIVVSTRKSVWPESCKYVLQRIVEPSTEDPNKYHFSRDNRLKVGPLVGMQHADILEYAKRVKCPMIVLKAAKSTYFENKKYFYDVIDVLQKNNKDFQYLKVDGSHHIHVNEPEKVSGIIKDFLKKYNNVDRLEGGIKEEIRIKTSN